MDTSAALGALVKTRYRLVELPNDGGPVHLAACLPMDGATDMAAPDYLPDAARIGRGRTPSGRGLDRREAAHRAAGEAAQLISACRWGDEDVVRAMIGDLDAKAIEPNAIGLVSATQFRERERHRTEVGAQDSEDPLPVPFDPGSAFDWVRYHAVGQQDRTVYVPAACTYIGWGGEHAASCCRADTNGTAAAPTLEEAVERAFLELVERDATAIWWFNQLRRPAVDADMLDLDETLVGWLAGRKRLYQIIDLTHDLGIPVAAAISAAPDGSRVAIGVSAHWNMAQAALSALTEMVQMEANLKLAANMPEIVADSALGEWVESVTLFNNPQFQPTGLAATPALGNVKDLPTMERIAHICNRAGLQAWWVDLTRETVGIPTARVVVPGLRPAKRRFAPGRLYNVPVQLGWLHNRVQEKRLNPTPLAL